MKRIFTCLIFVFIVVNAHARPAIDAPLEKRLEYFSQHWINTPYLLFPLGEGKKARYDQFPRHRFDAFDCQTFVETVLAMTFSKNSTEFKTWMDHIRYQNGKVSFLTRNHFTSVDWNENAHKNHFLKDITPNILNQKKEKIILYSNTLIDKAAWYQKLPLSRIRLDPSNPNQQETRLKELKEKGRPYKPTLSRLTYIPFSQLFDARGNPNEYLFQQIPNASIIEIVTPHWDLKQHIGTELDISHLGFAFWEKGTLWFIQASSIEHKVIKVPLATYLKEASKHPHIKGIHIESIENQIR